MSEKIAISASAWLEEAERRMHLDEAGLIEEIKRRRNQNEPGIPAERVRVFRKLLIQEIKQTGQLSREYADELLRKLINGEL